MKKFELGAIEVSSAASDILTTNGLDLVPYLSRHQSGDWGDIDNANHLRNDWALEHNGVILSTYKLPNGVTILVNTTGDRSLTCVLLETEYQAKEVSTQEGYALWAGSYDQEKNPLIAVEEPYVDRILAGLALTTALDAGTGTGRYARKLARQGIKVCALDQSPEMLAIARKNAQEGALKINFQRGSIDTLPFRSSHFELVVCGLVLCHIPDLIQILHEFSRVTKDGGYLLISDLHPHALRVGWRTVFAQAKAWYQLPNIRHTRPDYLAAVEAAGFRLLDVIDLRLGDMPDETVPFYKEWVREQGDQLFSLIIFAQKVVVSDKN